MSGQNLGGMFTRKSDHDFFDEARISVEFRASSAFSLSLLKTSALSLSRDFEAMRHAPFSGFCISLVLDGLLELKSGTRAARVGANDIFVLDMLERSEIGVPESVAILSLWCGRHTVLSGCDREDLLPGLVVPGRSVQGAVWGSALRSLEERGQRLEMRQFDGLGEGLIKLFLCGINSTLQGRDRSRVASFSTIRRYIDRNLHQSDLGPDSIAAFYAVSRSSIYRLFEPAGGIASYIAERRLSRAYDEIADPALSEQRIAPIAYRWGFKNITSFNRLFRERYGMSPSDVRRLSPGGGLEMQGTDRTGEHSLTEALLQLRS